MHKDFICSKKNQKNQKNAKRRAKKNATLTCEKKGQIDTHGHIFDLGINECMGFIAMGWLICFSRHYKIIIS